MASKKMSELMISDEQVISIFFESPQTRSDVMTHNYIKKLSRLNLRKPVKCNKRRDMTMDLIGRPKRIITRTMLSFLEDVDVLAQAINRSSSVSPMNIVPANENKSSQGKDLKDRKKKPIRPEKKKFHSVHPQNNIKRKVQTKKVIPIDPKKKASRKLKRNQVHKAALDTDSEARTLPKRNYPSLDITEVPVIHNLTPYLENDFESPSDMLTNQDLPQAPTTIPGTAIVNDVAVTATHGTPAIVNGVPPATVNAVPPATVNAVPPISGVRKSAQRKQIMPQNPFAALKGQECVGRAVLPAGNKKSQDCEKKVSWLDTLLSPIVNRLTSKKKETAENQ